MGYAIFFFVSSVLVSLPALSQLTQDNAENFPTRPVRIINPFPPGGGTESFARVLAHDLTDLWGQQVIVDNRGGAGGTIGSGLAAKSSPNGYTLLIGLSGTHGIAQSLYRQIPYDTIEDFTPITMLAIGPNILVVHPSVPAKSVSELIAFARAKPEQLNYGSAGIGTPPHLQMEVFCKMAGAKITHVPFQGSGPTTIALVSGQVQVTMISIPPGRPLIEAGKLRALGLTGAKRPASLSLSEYPTIAESGVPGYDENTWYGMFAPAGLPPAILRKLNADLVKVLLAPEIKARFAQDGQTMVGNSPEQFKENVRAEVVKWSRMIKELRIQPL